ncbi:hypothetical protein FRACYDRAFT_271953 [Fragilariopsis cylindrus CCMP1102]|uniref:Uncharacterized protein n=1 Tax=Fragilariopsis cylindrus CCMP1102 TaxID=635003 RepID=A0A1E7EPT3_9STRA|nr:hypothetical protein FRACYDRAFT_271953 [Fragilariopsis cylindrus CCMP1102]|eukprot:OEU07543.1 hypothetical protein FRACYDRAFT_271953 [Fragilariopsis cylindrus CCMP1102]
MFLHRSSIPNLDLGGAPSSIPSTVPSSFYSQVLTQSAAPNNLELKVLFLLALFLLVLIQRKWWRTKGLFQISVWNSSSLPSAIPS